MFIAKSKIDPSFIRYLVFSERQTVEDNLLTVL